MTALEKRLARRIHNQRRRLRQMEMFESWHDKTRLLPLYRKMLKESSQRLQKYRARGFWARLFNLNP